MPEQPTPTPTPVAAALPPEEPRPDPLAASVAEAVTRLRRDAGLSERAAAKKLGTSQTQLRRMEDPRYLPSLRSLQRVANAYGAMLKVSFDTQDSAPPKAEPLPKTQSPARAPRLAKQSRASAAATKARRPAPRRGRAAARPKTRRAAPRRRAR